MSSYGIEFNGQHSYHDMGYTVADKSIRQPAKMKNKQRVPYSNKVYDFSGMYGAQEYTERTLTYIFNVKDYEKIPLHIYETKILNWLMPPDEKLILKDDFLPGYYFKAEVEEAPDFDELKYHGRLTVRFTAYPFKISELHEGHDIWDDFNFELDYAQDTQYTVHGTKNITLYNTGAIIAHPKIITSAPMQIVKNGITYNVPAGESSSLDFYLDKGEINMTVIGNGDISFVWYKELI